MRLRSIAALSASALAVLALAGCGSVSDDGDATPSATATPSASAAPVEMCDAGEESGKAVDCVDVSGDFGSEATADFEAPLGIPDISSAVISEGDGDKIAAGDYVTYAATMYDAETGEKLGAEGYEPFSSLPLGIVEGSYLDAFVDVPLGSRVAFTIPQQTAATGQSVQAAVAVVTPAWDEPFGLVAVEAMAAGTPVAAFARGAPACALAGGLAPRMRPWLRARTVARLSEPLGDPLDGALLLAGWPGAKAGE